MDTTIEDNCFYYEGQRATVKLTGEKDGYKTSNNQQFDYQALRVRRSSVLPCRPWSHRHSDHPSR